ncbi:MAG TPA: tetratricopeptide repeat protein [Pyrinomonadaceae bacterium]|nr:tetratricopeptide repeat protein [Pyrinomonadaceae bacterium]
MSCATATAQGSSSEARASLRRGNEMYARAEYEAAIREYRRVSAGRGEVYAQSLYNIGVCHYELGRTAEAIEMYRSAVAASGGRYPKALYALGVALEDSGRWAEAKAAYRRALEVSGGNYREAQLAVAQYRLGLLAMRDGDYAGADALFKEAIARSRQPFPASHNNLGVALALAGRLELAGQQFELALKHTRGDFAEAAHNLSLCRTALAKGTKTQSASLKVVATITATIE